MNEASPQNMAAPRAQAVAPREDHYAEHLAAVNRENGVVATRDIVNRQGTLICARGTRIDAATAARLVRHRLAAPLAQQVELERVLDGAALWQRLEALFARHPDLRQVHEANRFDADARRHFLAWHLPAPLAQRLTVMAHQRPGDLDKGVFCAWLAMLVARELDRDPDDAARAYLAGLLHDVGFMHISPAVLDKQGDLTPEEWRAIQSHVVIGRLVLESTPAMDPEVARAVAEHHERCDGVGYPCGRSGEALGTLGQIIGLADSIHSIRVGRFGDRGRTMADLVPFLQLNCETHFYDVYAAAHTVIQRAGLQPWPGAPDADIPALATTLMERGTALAQVVEALDQPGAAVPKGRPPRRPDERMADHILRMMRQSGLLADELFLWLDEMRRQPDAAALVELEEIRLLQEELGWQLRNALRAFEAAAAAVDTGPDRARGLEALAARIAATLEMLDR